jgi:hypothetical protein
MFPNFSPDKNSSNKCEQTGSFFEVCRRLTVSWHRAGVQRTFLELSAASAVSPDFNDEQ